MIERVRSFVDAYQLNKVETKLLVAVSGGMDSMVLIDLLNELQCSVSIAHMNYGLRGNDSEEDEKFVQSYANKHGITFHLQRVDMDDLNGDSIQMAARTKRYAWFNELVFENGYDFILTAHHLNDSLETTLLNLVKGTGIKGLVGVSAQNGNILRPLVSTTKEELRAYALHRKLNWREDVSNAETKYLRNKLRNVVIPVLEEMNPSLLDTFRFTNERLEGANQLLEREIQRINETYIKSKGEIFEIDLGWYAPDHLNDVLLSEVLKPFGASYVLSKEIGRTNTTGAIFYTTTHQFNVDRRKLLISKRGEDNDYTLLMADYGSFEWGEWSIQLEASEQTDFMQDDRYSSSFDRAKISFPIEIRSWKQGDIFIPLGMTGKKKVSDFMIDSKIPLTLKKSIPLFVAGGEILWVGGHRIDDRYKITKQTKDVLKIKISRRD